jgi:hypothetical protein
MKKEEIDRRFRYYRADPDMVGWFEDTREMFRALAHEVIGPLPDSSEAEQAAVHLDESMRWIFAAMIRPGKESSGER